MKRTYHHGSRCHARMHLFEHDEERKFYYCRCSKRITFLRSLNASSGDWPKEIFRRAVAHGVFSKDGRAL